MWAPTAFYNIIEWNWKRHQILIALEDQAWLALYLESVRALLPASWADLALVSCSVHLF